MSKSSRTRKTASSAPAWHKQLEDVLRLIPNYDPWATKGDSWLDHDAARRAIDFFHECLRHVEGAKAGELFVLEPWQQAIVGNLFGWKRKDASGRVVRRYREFFLYVPRKNGKTPLAAGICCYVLFCDNEPGAQIYSAAAEKDQAAYLFRQAKGMIEREPELASRATIYGGSSGTGGQRCIVLKSDPASVYKVLSADADTKHGGNSHLVLIDELHAQPNRDLVDVLASSTASKNRAQPILGYITTADYDRPSICNEKHDYACRVRDNNGDPSKPGYDPGFLPIIYETLPDEDWKSPEVWKKCNPNYGVSVSEEYLARECQKAQEQPAYENTFKRLHLNMKTTTDVKLIPLDAWDQCVGRLHDDDAMGLTWYGGLDLASTEDLASFTLSALDANDILWSKTWVWCPVVKIEKRKRMRIPYDVWAKEGHLIATGGDQIDYAVIEQQIEELAGKYTIAEIGFDGWNAAQITQNLTAKGLTLIKIPQSFRELSAPSKEMLRRIKGRTFRHEGSPLVRWCAGNVAADFDGRLPSGESVVDQVEKVPIKPSKKKSADKIDPIASTVISINRLIAHPAAQDDGMFVHTL